MRPGFFAASLASESDSEELGEAPAPESTPPSSQRAGRPSPASLNRQVWPSDGSGVEALQQKLLDNLQDMAREEGKELGAGWVVSVSKRKNGATKGTWDPYYHSPCGKRFRSKAEVRFGAHRDIVFHAADDAIVPLDAGYDLLVRPAYSGEIESEVKMLKKLMLELCRKSSSKH